jgi:hypothetical protein
VKTKLLQGLAIAMTLNLAGCMTMQPNNVDNVCCIFQQYPDWYTAAKKSQGKWGVPVPVQMAIMHQESTFRADARPPRQVCLGFIPWSRPTSAYGYAQAVNSTWSLYQRGSGNCYASRENFKDATDFIGWYARNAKRKLNIAPTNAYALYLAYHEGLGGYAKKTYLRKPWLIKVAKKVALRARVYQCQLASCKSSLEKKHWWSSRSL